MLLRTYSLSRNELFHKFLSRTLRHRFKNTSLQKMGLLWSIYFHIRKISGDTDNFPYFLAFCLNTEKYWSDKNHTVLLTIITNLLHTLCKRIMQIYLLAFFINTFIGESPFLLFCDIFHGYFFNGSGKKSPPETSPPLPPDPKPNPIPNLTLTLPLTPHGGFFPGRIFS